jgi:Domain of unknown function (DUF4062)
VARNTPKKNQPPQFEPIETPIIVFLSSDQDEFDQDRLNLKSDIEEIKLKLARPIRVILVEKQRGPQWRKEMLRGLDVCDIFVLLLGTEYSETVREEFQRASGMNLPIYIYRYIKDGHRLANPRKGQLHDFITQDILPTHLSIRGYNEPYQEYTKLFDEIAADLASCVVMMVHESAQVRRVIGR